MNIPGLTAESLKALHDLIGVALASDDALSPGTPKAYGVREHPDWRKQANQFEAEMTKRDIAFTPIAW